MILGMNKITERHCLQLFRLSYSPPLLQRALKYRLTSTLARIKLNGTKSAQTVALVQEYASHEQTMISLQQLLQTGKQETAMQGKGRLGQRLANERVLMDYAALLKRELPIRLAHRIQDLEQVPQLRNMPSVQNVKSIYLQSFLDLVEIPDPQSSPDLERRFGYLLKALYANHSDVLLQMARGAWEFKAQIQEGRIPQGSIDTDAHLLFARQEECHACLNRFYASRVGIRVLAGQYLAVRHQLLGDDDHGRDVQWRRKPLAPAVAPISSKYVGMICYETSPYHVVQKAISDATRLCVAQFGHAPPVQVRGQLDLTFPYIPTHLHYILLELLKNALRATMEYHSKSATKPHIVVIIADDAKNEDVIIKVADEGGGIPRSQMEHIWSYLYTTANPNVQKDFLQPSAHHVGGGDSDAPILAGLGYGLPMSRAYARYFGGDLDIISMEGYGTDAFCYLRRLGDKAPLPV